MSRLSMLGLVCVFSVACGSSESAKSDGPVAGDQQAQVDQSTVELGADGSVETDTLPTSDTTGDTSNADSTVDSSPSADGGADITPHLDSTLDTTAFADTTVDTTAGADSTADTTADGVGGLWETEPNNGYQDANDFTGYTFPLEINAILDWDTFLINAQAGTLLRITLTPTDAETDFAPSFNVDHASGRSSYRYGATAPGVGQPATRQVFIVEDGPHFIRVVGYRPGGHYLLRIENVPLPTPTDLTNISTTSGSFNNGEPAFYSMHPAPTSHVALDARTGSLAPPSPMDARVLVWDPTAKKIVIVGVKRMPYHPDMHMVWEHLEDRPYWIIVDAEAAASDASFALDLMTSARMDPGSTLDTPAPATVGQTVTSSARENRGGVRHYTVWLEAGSYAIEVDGTVDSQTPMVPWITVLAIPNNNTLRAAHELGRVASTILRVEESQAVNLRLLDYQVSSTTVKTSYTLKITPSTFLPTVVAGSGSSATGQIASSGEFVRYAIDHPGGVLVLSVDGDAAFDPDFTIWPDSLFAPGQPYGRPDHSRANRWTHRYRTSPGRYYVDVKAHHSDATGSFTLRWEAINLTHSDPGYLNEAETSATLGSNDSCATAEDIAAVPGVVFAELDSLTGDEPDAFTFTATSTTHRLRTTDTLVFSQDLALALYDPADTSTPLAQSEDIDEAKDQLHTEINASGLTIGKQYCVVARRDPDGNTKYNAPYALLITAP